MLFLYGKAQILQGTLCNCLKVIKLLCSFKAFRKAGLINWIIMKKGEGNTVAIPKTKIYVYADSNTEEYIKEHINLIIRIAKGCPKAQPLHNIMTI